MWEIIAHFIGLFMARNIKLYQSEIKSSNKIVANIG